MEWITWVIEHKTEMTAVIGGAVTFASIIVKLTPTETDNIWLAKIVGWLNVLAINPKK